MGIITPQNVMYAGSMTTLLKRINTHFNDSLGVTNRNRRKIYNLLFHRHQFLIQSLFPLFLLFYILDTSFIELLYRTASRCL